MTRVDTERLRSALDRAGAAGIVATTAENIAYLTGILSVPLRMFPHTGQSFVVVSREEPGRPVFVSSRCEVDQALDADVELGAALAYGPFFRERGPGAVLTDREQDLARFAVDGPQHETAADGLIAGVRAAGLNGSPVLVDEDGILPGPLAALRSVTEPRPDRSGSALLRDVRKTKTDQEIELVTASARLAEDGIRAVLAAARPGVTDTELVRTFDRTVAAGGGRPEFTLIKIGRSAVAGQTAPSGTALRRGDTIWFDVGCTLSGYWSDIARVACLGEPSDQVARYYAAVLAGADAGIKEARPGMTGGELFDVTVAGVRDGGIPHYRRHHVGHGIGVEVYDRVLLTPGNTDVLEPGTVVNIETPYYEFGFGAVHVEDPFVVTAAGNQLLTSLDRGLLVVD